MDIRVNSWLGWKCPKCGKLIENVGVGHTCDGKKQKSLFLGVLNALQGGKNVS